VGVCHNSFRRTCRIHGPCAWKHWLTCLRMSIKACRSALSSNGEFDDCKMVSMYLIDILQSFSHASPWALSEWWMHVPSHIRPRLVYRQLATNDLNRPCWAENSISVLSTNDAGMLFRCYRRCHTGLASAWLYVMRSILLLNRANPPATTCFTMVNLGSIACSVFCIRGIFRRLAATLGSFHRYLRRKVRHQVSS
jgi:hypothetical protein